MVRLGWRRKKKRVEEDLSDRLITLSDPDGAASEAYRTLRTNLLYAAVDMPPKVISVTSPGPHEGKSTTCANLAIVLAQADKKTLLMDCDFRKPVIHKMFGLRNLRGIVDVLAGEYPQETVWHEPVEGLKVLTVGPQPPNPAELAGSRRFAEYLARARHDFDYVLIDSPPIQLVSDPAIIGTQGDGVLLVLDAQNTRKAVVRQSIRSLRTVGAPILGTIMNNVEMSREGYYGYTYKY